VIREYGRSVIGPYKVNEGAGNKQASQYQLPEREGNA
jgi:hypothetical protein